MRLSADRYPEDVDYTCTGCWTDWDSVERDEIDGDDVVVTCPGCAKVQYVRVIY